MSPIALCRQTKNLTGVVNVKDENPTLAEDVVLARFAILLKQTLERIPKCQSQTSTHDAFGINRVHQGLLFRLQQVAGFIVNDH
jgi:hypothetical protein